MFESFSTDTVRDAFGKSLCSIAEKDEKIVLISADSWGASKTRDFNNKYPDRSINVGIAEQNMVSVAAGFALEGFIPFVSTRAPFLAMRCMEQIRSAVCYDNLPVRFVGTGAGYCSGPAGATHWALEDVAIFSAIGNMTVFETGDRILISRIMEESLDWKKPMYIRLARDIEQTIYDDSCSISLSRSNTLITGEDGCFIVSGSTVMPALEAANNINRKTGANISVIDMFCIKPIDREAVLSAAKTGRIVVAQDHNIIGGLGNIVAFVLAESGAICRLKVLGCPDYFVPVATADYLYHKYEYDAEGLEKNMMLLLDT